MSEINKKDLHTAIILGLGSKDNKVVLNSINQLRQEGKPEDVNHLFDLLLSTPTSEIKVSILNFLADLKIQETDKIIIEAIKNDKYLSIRKSIVEVCWEASIDFSKHLSVFVDLLIEADFEIAFEAFTVIENITEKVPEMIKPVEMTKLKNAIPGSSAEKKGMIHEAIHIIDQL
ncbi:hypothetical protein L3049_03945 [Labilibaculum sp. DW002]|uniref:HEAT repeat domain-containing protein n=1 Tax=Paralabilibaculum antarcticum TaxID=2912572 RepID=A0ABT5VPF1_9BACT|nr:hypothetical protein [Labilibaculum sp. DW002]MDE5417151.1 hypothetical protein [Labilibaculum sp. DW002]